MIISGIGNDACLLEDLSPRSREELSHFARHLTFFLVILLEIDVTKKRMCIAVFPFPSNVLSIAKNIAWWVIALLALLFAFSGL